jgi:hypothetical protein
VNKSFPKAKTKLGRVAKFLRGPLLGSSVSIITNGLAVVSSNIFTAKLGETIGKTAGVLIGGTADAVPHVIQELHAHKRDKQEETPQDESAQACARRDRTQDKPPIYKCLRCVSQNVRHKAEYVPPCHIDKSL